MKKLPTWAKVIIIIIALPIGYKLGYTIMYDDELGVYFGASESRKDGSAMGY